VIFIGMGRKKIDNDKKKVKLAVSVDPEIPNYFKDKSINLSSLVNKLLKEYIKNGNEGLF
jgi:post-segregation antitoxin (ccd killing protein)